MTPVNISILDHPKIIYYIIKYILYKIQLINNVYMYYNNKIG